jgi:DNA-binding CsgD family transcriptional regulator
MRPHLAQAFRQVRLRVAMRRAVEAAGSGRDGILIVDDGEIVSASTQARRLLDGRRLQSQIRARIPAAPAGPTRVALDFDSVHAEILAAPGEPTVVLLSQNGGPPADPERLRELGLTRREAEVLSWVACGRTNPQIARTLWLSPRTVQKHLQHIFEKLGVSTRTEAAARALRQ